MNENWKIRQYVRGQSLDGTGGTALTTIYTAAGILDAIQQHTALGFKLADIVSIKKE